MKKITSAIILSLSLTTWAQNPPDTQTTPVANYNSYSYGESASARQNKKYQAAVILTGLGPSYTPSTGISLGYFMHPDSMILVEMTSGKTTARASSSGTGTASDDFRLSSRYDISGSSFGVHYKQFSGNSFYFRAGIDYRRLDYKYGTTYYGALEEATFKGDSLAANFQIGNQWQWDNFTLGCDWVGISMPITSTEKERSLNAAATAADTYGYNKQLDDDSDLLIKNMNINLLRFYLGASF